jgi:flagellar motility protein MotE (MotC chaperone)
MERQIEHYRTKTAERDRRPKARKGISVRPNFLFIAGLVLITLLAAKIFISGIYLHSDTLNIPILDIAMAKENIGGIAEAKEAEDAKKTETKQAETKQSDADLNAKTISLKAKEQELKDREAAVIRKEQSLAPLQAEVDAKIEQLNELQLQLTALAKDIAGREQALKDEKINHLVTLYSSMDASKAANILDKLNIDTVVRILANMKGKSAGQILAAMSAEKGARISEKLSDME